MKTNIFEGEQVKIKSAFRSILKELSVFLLSAVCGFAVWLIMSL